MSSKILIIQGHPDQSATHFDHALADAYADGAIEAGHQVRRLSVAGLDFPLLRNADEFEGGSPPPDIANAQQDILWADHLVIVFPLWLGEMPALLKGFFEQVARPGFAFVYRDNKLPEKKLTGKSARLIITMGMPAFVYSLFYRAHGVKNLKRNILAFVGIAPVRDTLIGLATLPSLVDRTRQLARIGALGRTAR